MKKKVILIAVLIIVLVLMIFGFNSCSSSNDKSNVKEDKVTTDKKETENKENSDKVEAKDESSKISDDEDKSKSTTLPSTNDNKTPTANTTTSKSNSSTSNTKQNNGGSSSTKPSTHTHNWVKKVIHHDAVTHTEQVLVSEAWDEPIYETKYASVCNTCGADITGFAPEHLLETEHDSYRTGIPIKTLVDYNHHDAVYETKTIVDKAAYDEVIYTCSCGAKK